MMSLNCLTCSYSMSDIQDHIDYIIKKVETLPTNPRFQIYINRINNDPISMKLSDSAKK